MATGNLDLTNIDADSDIEIDDDVEIEAFDTASSNDTEASNCEATEDATASETAGPAGEEAAAEHHESVPHSDDDTAESAYRRRIADLEHQYTDAGRQVATLQARLKMAKGMQAEILEQLTETIASGPERHPLFDDQPKSKGEPEQSQTTAEAAVENATEPTTTPQAAYDLWRDVELQHVSGLTGAMLGLLYDAGVETVGQFEDLRGSKGGLLRVKGVGRGKADKMEDAMLKWLSENRDILPA